MSPSKHSNVPRERGAFVGRQTELAAIEEAFAGGAPLVTLLGPTGVGKTRLALRHAALQQEALSSAGGVWFCDLTEARDTTGLCAVVAPLLAVPLLSGPTDDAVRRLGYAIARRGPLLLVLDNFEQLDAGAVVAVREWLSAAPQAMFLVTSQRALRIEDEHVIDVAPLSPPQAEDVAEVAKSPAVELFVLRARAIRSDYELSASNAPLVAAIVRKLEGVPLGIELCAARVGLLGEGQILKLLEKQLDVLVSSTGHAAKHSALRTAIERSVDLLNPWQRDALAQCSVFRGGFSLETVENVVDLAEHADAPRGGLWAHDVLSSLEQASLVSSSMSASGGEVRYRLFDSVRQYAQEQLEKSGGAEGVQQRHTSYFLEAARGWADGIDGPGGVRLRRRLARETDNLLSIYERELERRGRARHALEAILALEGVFSTRGPFGRYGELLDAALTRAAAEGIAPELESRALSSRGLLAILSGRLEDAAEHYVRALEAAERAGDAELSTTCCVKIGLCHGLAGRAEESDGWLSRARAVLDASSLRVQRTYYNDVGLVLTQQGRTRAAQTNLEKALELHQRTGNRRDEGVALGNIGGRYFERGLLEEARDYYDRGRAVLQEVGDRRSAAVLLAHLGQADVELGELDAGRLKLEEALATQREVGDRAWEGIVLSLLGNLELERQNASGAVALYQQSVATLSGSSYRRNAGLGWAALGVAEALLGHGAEARTAMARATETLERVGTPGDRAALEVLGATATWLLARAEGSAPDEVEARYQELCEIERDLARASTTDGIVPDEERFALRIAERLRQSPTATVPSAPPSRQELVIGPGARWFAPPGGSSVDIRRRGALRRILALLSERRVSEPGRGASVTELFEGAWPGESAAAKGAAARVYVGLGTLRRLGLQGVLLRSDEGYYLDPDVPLLSEPEH